MRVTKVRASLLAVAAASLARPFSRSSRQPAARRAAGAPQPARPRRRAAGGGPQPVPAEPPMKVYHLWRPEDARRGAARLSAVPRRLEQAAPEPQRDRRRRSALPVAHGAARASTSLVIYKGDAGYVSLEDRANLDAYLRRGGGIVSIHDALCGRRHRRTSRPSSAAPRSTARRTSRSKPTCPTRSSTRRTRS